MTLTDQPDPFVELTSLQRAERMMQLFPASQRGYATYNATNQTRADGKAKVLYKTVRKPVTPSLWMEHLAGTRPLVLGLACDDGTSGVSVVDVDDYQVDTIGLTKRIKLLGLPLYVCTSKSGGAHVLAFHDAPIPIDQAREVARGMARKLELGDKDKNEDKDRASQVEFFPKPQNTDPKVLPKGLNIPFYGGNRCIIYPDSKVAGAMSVDQFLREVKRLTAEQRAALLADKRTRQGPTSQDEGGRYADAQLKKYVADLRDTPEGGGRNDKLNKHSFHLGTMVAREWIGRDAVEQALREVVAEWSDQPKTIDTLTRGLDDGAKQPHADLRDTNGFERAENGTIRPRSQKNIRRALELLEIILRHNVFEDRMMVAGLEGFDVLNDAAIERLWLLVDERFRFLPTKDFFFTVVVDTARQNSFHPVRDYLGDLIWDGKPRIDMWLTTYGGAEDSEYVRAVGALLLVAAVRRVRQPGCKFDEMVVLESPQGAEKSTVLATLAVNSDWFSDDLPLGADSKKMIEHLRGRWIVEAAELNGMKKADVEHLKSFLSRQRDRARMSYDRTMTELPRQAVVVGTTNHSQYLRDLTGNRRYWPVAVSGFDIAALRRDRDQLWAEAARREAGGASIRLDPKLWAVAEGEQQERTIDDPWIATVKHLVRDLEGKMLCEDAWTLIGLPAERRQQEHNARLGQAFRAAGFVRKKLRIAGKVEWCYSRGNSDRRILVNRSPEDVVSVHLEGPHSI